MYLERETKYDGFAKKLYYDWKRVKNFRLPLWERLDFKERDEWRGIAQLTKRERKHFKKFKKRTGERYERHTIRSN